LHNTFIKISADSTFFQFEAAIAKEIDEKAHQFKAISGILR